MPRTPRSCGAHRGHAGHTEVMRAGGVSATVQDSPVPEGGRGGASAGVLDGPVAEGGRGGASAGVVDSPAAGGGPAVG